MNGIPLPLWIDGDRETVYLATRRSGAPGEAMRECKRIYHESQMRASGLLQRIALYAQMAERLNPKQADFGQRLETLAAEQEDASLALQEHKCAAVNAAERLVRLSLEENYGKDAERFLNLLTDQQLTELVTVIESGDVPEDFFPDPATRLSASGTSPAGAGAGGSSSSTDTSAATSKAGTSGSKTRTSSASRRKSSRKK